MSLFKFQSDKVEVSSEIASISEFATLLKKKNSTELIAYVFHLCDWKSPYAKWDIGKKKEMLKKDLLGGKEPTKELEKAVAKYNELNQTDSLLLLESARRSVQKLRTYFDDADPALEDDSGKAAKDLMANLKNVGDIIEKLKEWEETILKEKDELRTRKGVVIDKYNEG